MIPPKAPPDELREAHRQHVHRDGCHRWYDHEAEQMLDLAGPAGWCDGCNEDWPCDTTRALNRAVLGCMDEWHRRFSPDKCPTCGVKLLRL